jgi:hypothetical protein
LEDLSHLKESAEGVKRTNSLLNLWSIILLIDLIKQTNLLSVYILNYIFAGILTEKKILYEK